MSITNHPKIEMLATTSLKPRKRNPRKHDENQLAKIEASISRFGFLVPVIVDDRLEIVAGHARVASKHSKRAGDMLFVKTLEILTKSRIDVFRLIDPLTL